MSYEDTNSPHNSFNNTPISLSTPTSVDIQNTKSLQQILRKASYLAEDPNHRQQREHALQSIDQICQKWVQSLAQKLKYSKEFVKLSKVSLFTYGSFKLNVHSSNDDIDILCVGPSFLTRDSFFQELGNSLESNPNISDFIAVPNAFVPVLSFKYNQCIDIDIVYAQLQTELIDSFDIMNDDTLYGLDTISIYAINGARFANKILELIPNKTVFRLSLRAIRYWAKQRHIYSNKIGYLGGASWAILTARVCQLYPNANASQIIQKFFLFYHTWNFHNAIMLSDIVTYENMSEIKVWDPYEQQSMGAFGCMYVITPVFPAMNSSHNVSISTFQIIKREIARGFHILGMECDISDTKWTELFSKHTFFMDYTKYICIKGCAVQQNITKWSGLIESKIRAFVNSMEWNINIGLVPLHKSIEWKVRQSEMDKCTHSQILEQRRLRALHLRLSEQKQEIESIYFDECEMDNNESEIILYESNVSHSPQINAYCYVAPELQKKYTNSKYACVHGQNVLSCCDGFNNDTLQKNAESIDGYECRAFVIGIQIYKDEILDFTQSISAFLKALNHCYSDSHVVIELVSCNKLPHFLFGDYGFKRPNKECMQMHQNEMEMKYETWMNNKLGSFYNSNANSNGYKRKMECESEPRNKRRKLNGLSKVDWTRKFDDSLTFEYALNVYKKSQVFSAWESVSRDLSATAVRVYNECSDTKWKERLKEILSNDKYGWDGSEYGVPLNKQLMFELANDIGLSYISYKESLK